MRRGGRYKIKFDSVTKDKREYEYDVTGRKKNHQSTKTEITEDKEKRKQDSPIRRLRGREI